MILKKKHFIILLFIFVFYGFSLASQYISLKGKICIEGINRIKKYDARLIVLNNVIEINCIKSIFQPFNEFDSPITKRIKFNISELSSVIIDEEDKQIIRILLVFNVNSFTQKRYRNVFQTFYVLKKILMQQWDEFQAIEFNIYTLTKKQKEFLLELKKQLPGQ